jgi:hypothetical protein
MRKRKKSWKLSKILVGGCVDFFKMRILFLRTAELTAKMVADRRSSAVQRNLYLFLNQKKM